MNIILLKEKLLRILLFMFIGSVFCNNRKICGSRHCTCSKKHQNSKFNISTIIIIQIKKEFDEVCQLVLQNKVDDFFLLMKFFLPSEIRIFCLKPHRSPMNRFRIFFYSFFESSFCNFCSFLFLSNKLISVYFKYFLSIVVSNYI